MHKATSWARKGAKCLSFIKSTSRTPQATRRNHVSASSKRSHWAWQQARLKAQSARSSETSWTALGLASSFRAARSITSRPSTPLPRRGPCPARSSSSNSLVSWAFFSSPLSFGFWVPPVVCLVRSRRQSLVGAGLLGREVVLGVRHRCLLLRLRRGCCMQRERLLFAFVCSTAALAAARAVFACKALKSPVLIARAVVPRGTHRPSA